MILRHINNIYATSILLALYLNLHNFNGIGNGNATNGVAAFTTPSNSGRRCCAYFSLGEASSSCSLIEIGCRGSSKSRISNSLRLQPPPLQHQHHHHHHASNIAKEFPSRIVLQSAQSSEDQNQGQDQNQNQGQFDPQRLLGILVLMTVPLSWGTYAPVVKYVYELEPPIPGFIFSAGYYIIASVTLLSLSVVNKFKWKEQEMELDVKIASNDYLGEKNIENDGVDVDGNANTDNADGISNKIFSLQSLAGLELGSYLFLGNCLQVIGLETVPADRAAFLVQLTTIMVPLVQAFTMGSAGAGAGAGFASIPLATWGACLLAFAGVIIMGLDRPEVDVSNMINMNDLAKGLSFTTGDSLIVLAAVAYTMHVVRLGRYAKVTTPLGLAASKATVEAMFSLILVSLLFSLGGTGLDFGFVNGISSEITSYASYVQHEISSGTFPPANSGKAFAAILWTGWVTCAYTIYAQSFGQRRIPPTDANLIYSMQPLFSALFAYILLGETLGAFGYVGAALIGSALTIVALSQSDGESEIER